MSRADGSWRECLRRRCSDRRCLTAPRALAAGPGEGPDRGGRPPTAAGSIERAQAFLRAMTDAYPAAQPRATSSRRATPMSSGCSRTAFVYDVALAVCAARRPGAGAPNSLAETIGDGLVYALEHDPQYSDGRLRQAYNVGPVRLLRRKPPAVRLRPTGRHGEHRFSVRLPGHRGRRHGLAGHRAWCSSIGRTREAHSTSGRPSGSAPGSPPTQSRRDHSAGSGSESMERTNRSRTCPPSTTSTASRSSVSSTGPRANATGSASARRALGFVSEDVVGRGAASSTPGPMTATTINPYPLPLDPQTWSWLALRDRRYARALEWA